MCRDADLECRVGDPCIIICRGTNACTGNVNMGANGATDMTLICDGIAACQNGDFQCGSGDCEVQCYGSDTACDIGHFSSIPSASSFQCTGNYCTSFLIDQEFTATPTQSPTISDTESPTKLPSISPSSNPSSTPSKSPSISPSTQEPTSLPTNDPSELPSKSPTKVPSLSPTQIPSNNPSNAPSLDPTDTPTTGPLKYQQTLDTTTNNPSQSPSDRPTQIDISLNAGNPTMTPSANDQSVVEATIATNSSPNDSVESQPSPSNGSMPVWALAAIGSGGIVVVTCGIMIFVVIYRKRKIVNVQGQSTNSESPQLKPQRVVSVSSLQMVDITESPDDNGENDRDEGSDGEQLYEHVSGGNTIDNGENEDNHNIYTDNGNTRDVNTLQFVDTNVEDNEDMYVGVKTKEYNTPTRSKGNDKSQSRQELSLTNGALHESRTSGHI